MRLHADALLCLHATLLTAVSCMFYVLCGSVVFVCLLCYCLCFVGFVVCFSVFFDYNEIDK